ncbi:MAG TPA: bifunctional oligoribonuclease/PAP phosphatase NrnA [Bacteroidales bacterium]|nr:bifunctional oligoribonuclease/PAP phosphatase NrnA [Bacteroidales bacterium]HSA42637.1 bifunctional oligoribonuclease/PAP phosphatase NrnA [Bacteroidales bacterium]
MKICPEAASGVSRVGMSAVASLKKIIFAEKKLAINHFHQIKALLVPGTRVLITTHANPDGDAVGASLALKAYFSKLGIISDILVPNDYPSFLAWMPGIDQVVVFKRNESLAMKLAGDAKLVFCLDFNGLSRVEKMQKIWPLITVPLVMIDHHPQPEEASFALMISETATSSTSELVYNFIEMSGDKELIDKSMAECLFVGIATDTGSFSYSCGYPETFHVVADLISKGIDPERIHRLVYDNYSEHRMRLLGYCLSEKLTVLHQFNTAYIYLSKEDLKRFHFQVGDTEGVVNYALSIDGICMAVLFTEKDNHVRMSLRSKGQFSVNEFVRNHFEGGGHKNAAGGNSYLSMDETLRKFEALLPQYQELLKNCCVLCKDYQ